MWLPTVLCSFTVNGAVQGGKVGGGRGVAGQPARLSRRLRWARRGGAALAVNSHR